MEASLPVDIDIPTWAARPGAGPCHTGFSYYRQLFRPSGRNVNFYRDTVTRFVSSDLSADIPAWPLIYP
jgi:hypothetical protein